MNEELKVIITAEIDKLKQELKKGQKEVENFEKKSKVSFQEFNDGIQSAGNVAKKSLAVAGTAILGAATALLALSASTAEYRQNQAKLTAAFETAGASAEVAKDTYNDLFRVLGDDGQTTEAANHLAQLTTNEKDLAEWTNICQGVYATFGDSLPIESLTEAANETAKTGALTGALADALNWAGVSEEAFQAKLDACNTEAEREKLIRETLNGVYDEASANYEKVAASTLAQNEAQAQLNDKMAALGEAMAPINTALTEFASKLLDELMPIIEEFMANHGEQLEQTLNDIAEAIGNVLTWIIDNWDFVSTLAVIILGIAAALTVFSTAMGIVNAVMMASPVTWIVLAIVAAIAALVAIIVVVIKYWDEIAAFAVKAWEKIRDTFKGIGEWFGNIFNKAWNGIKNAFSKVGSFFKGIWNTITSIFSNVGQAIGNAITGTVKKAVNAVLSTAISIINGFISAINFAISIINAIPGVNIGKLNKLGVPQLAKGGIATGDTLAHIGEDGYREAVLPLDRNTEWMDELANRLSGSMGGQGPIILQVDGKTFGEISIDSINQLTRQRGKLALNIV
jgi:phage-related protein